MLVVFEATSMRRGALVNDDVLDGSRLRLFSVAAELGNVGRPAGSWLRLRQISDTLAQERWGGIALSPNGLWRFPCAATACRGGSAS